MFELHRLFVEPLETLLEKGGWVIVEIGLVSVLAWTMIIYIWRKLDERTNGNWKDIDAAIGNLRRGKAFALAPTDPNVVRVILQTVPLTGRMDRKAFETCIAPILESERLFFRQSLRIVAGMASVMPLLGLLGTVLGMIQTFTALTQHGAVDAEGLARGISTALTATELGLVLALVVVLVHAFLGYRVRHYLDAAQFKVKQIEIAVFGDN